MKKILYLLAAATIATGIVSCSKWRDPVVATVDGGNITASELRTEMDMARGMYDPALLTQKENFEEFRRQALDKLAQEAILLAEAKRVGVDTTKEDMTELERQTGQLASLDDAMGPGAAKINLRAWKESQRRRLIIQKLVKQEVIDRVPVTDDEVAAYFKQHSQEFNQPQQFHARQILVDTRDLADQILSKIKQGGDFEKLAQEYSISPDAKRGGDLGFFDARAYPEIFAEICGRLKPGETSEVVSTGYGFQIFQLIDKRPARQIPFDEARSKIKEMLQEKAAEPMLEGWAGAINARSNVAINENVLKEVGVEK